MVDIDETDRKILRQLQADSSISLEELGERVALSRNACWRRIRAMESEGLICKRVALLNAEALGLGLSVFILVRTSSHDAKWLDKFARATRSMPEILGAYRMTGDLDYLIRARVRDVADYDRLYRKLIEKVEMSDVSASFVMEELKETTELPL
jgi:Lrp/AsnC family transcriptional regulator